MKYPKILLDTKYWGEHAAYSEDSFKQKNIEMVENGYEASRQPDYDFEWEFIRGSDGLYSYDSAIGENHNNIDPYSLDYLMGQDVDSVYIKIKTIAKATWIEKSQHWKMEEISRTETEIPQWS